MGIDCSTNSLAYGVVEDGKLITHGEIMFYGKDIHARLVDARKKTEANIALFDVDFIVWEQAVMVRSIAVAIKMAEVFGAVKSVILEGSAVHQFTPIQWQEAIGNPVIKGNARKLWAAKRPELKTKSQIDTAVRKYRKQITMDWVEKNYGLKAANDNISDAVAIAHVGHLRLVKKNG
ncbi:RuvC-like resolvase [Rhodococcus phage NiceHouse]|nr:RuvC-like resolvase [Rhodococcus phage NiceHouse]